MLPVNTDIYQTQYVRNLFNSMSETYGWTNYFSSFGFTVRWRRQCVERISAAIAPSAQGYDLMSGMGEIWPFVLPRLNAEGRIVAVDISEVMQAQAAAFLEKTKEQRVVTLQADMLQNGLPDGSADFIVSSFGLKTFSPVQLEILAKEVNRLLKPGGAFAFIEVSVPEAWWLRGLYLFYLQRIIPVIGYLSAGRTSDYRMLGIYCTAFQNSRAFCQMLQEQGLTEAKFDRYFAGCATGVSGVKS